jgi:hypothetical protein
LPSYTDGMGDRGSDTTRDWQLPERAKPPLIGELVQRIDEAVAIARSSEAAVMTVGAAALDAAEQAKRAAELAERASAAMQPRPGAFLPHSDMKSPGERSADDDLGDFSARADRVAERLRQLQRLPLSA